MLYSDSTGQETFDSVYHDHLQQTDESTSRYIYEIHVIQQPLRARMCGFGEKDRRPCTPPPILQLIIYDRATGQPVNMDMVDVSFFTAACSLYSVEMDTELDLIHQQRGTQDSGLGSVSTMSGNTAVQQSRHMSHTSKNSMGPSNNDADGMLQSNSPPFGSMTTGPMSNTANSLLSNASNSDRDAVVFTDFINGHNVAPRGLGQHLASSSSIMSFSAGNERGGSLSGGIGSVVDGSYDSGGGSSGNFSSSTSDSSMCTVRNLIGASVTTGAKLNNVDGSLGVFFVFPDLSIRKDGDYRFRFSFFDLQSDNGDLLKTSADIKARAFSEPFRVYSAKQFPGMIESTPLSKHFAKQGVKIPVRKETIGKSRQSPDDDDWQNN
ncbi:hypothetical protein LPJ66_002168 [Kickxella alabastrina]|uniref:Uncharacterized protein n=1 Tax=Kickxella alabastrina TaxID=61397 RepID=A0ACC1IR65_9FUNG|nr:hypothetical protein LPJ66_002168 [Kickxella alabastrina]